MKWIFYVLLLIYTFYRAVYGAKIKEIGGVKIETVKYENDKNYLVPGVRKTINCTASNKNQRLQWIDPAGNVVKRIPANRVYVQENLVTISKSPLARARVPALLLVFTKVDVKDTGVWKCQAGGFEQTTSLCVIEPSRFVETPKMTVDSGRSITLSCQATGDPEPRVVWYRNGRTISDDESSTKYQVMTKYNSLDSVWLLTITSVGAEDSGVYTCEAIQESFDDCVHVESKNITLEVNYAPMFKDGNETKIVYGTQGESIELVCSASGFPIPTYKWLKDIEETSFEFGEENVQVINDGTEALLTLTPDSYSWNETYRCRATNPYGDVFASFLLMKTEKPTKPNNIKPYSDTTDKIQLEITWSDGINFSVNSIEVQYLKKRNLKGLSQKNIKESIWLRPGVQVQRLEPENIDSEGLNVTLTDLEENTEYYIRLRVVNIAGESQWSKSILAATVEMPEVLEELEDLDKEAKNTTVASMTEQMTDSTFYGIFFTGGIAIIVVAAAFLMKLV